MMLDTDHEPAVPIKSILNKYWDLVLINMYIWLNGGFLYKNNIMQFNEIL